MLPEAEATGPLRCHARSVWPTATARDENATRQQQSERFCKFGFSALTGPNMVDQGNALGTMYDYKNIFF
jgi:hypothetical protein